MHIHKSRIKHDKFAHEINFEIITNIQHRVSTIYIN